MSNDFTSQFQAYQTRVNDFLATCPADLPENLALSAAKYSLTAPGKRLRPILAIATYEALSGQTASADVVQLAGSLEMVHTFSLIHDDLPALDNDTLRRGLPTCHTQFNEASAILAGDFLLTHAFTNLTATASPAATVQLLTQVLAAAVTQLIIGEQNDLLGETTALDKTQLAAMFVAKTGALFGASLAFGAIIAGAADSAPYLALGHDLGLAFQIQDDVLDIVGNQQELGKNIGSDLAQNKSTWVKFYGLAQAQADYRQYYQQTAQKLSALLATSQSPAARQFLLDLITFLQDRHQ